MKLMGIIGIAIMAVVLLIIGVIVSSILIPKQKITNFEECVASGNPIMESYPQQCQDKKSGEIFTEEQKIVVSIPCEVDELDCKNFKNQAVAQELFEKCGGFGSDIHNLDPDENGIACEDYNYE